MIKTKNIARALIGLVEDDGHDSNKIADNFINFSKKHKMEDRINTVLNVLEEKEKQNKQHDTVFVKTAYPVPERLLIKIKKHLRLPQDAPSNISLDETILGGFRVLYKGKLYEYDLKSKLNKLKNNLHSNHLK